MAKVAGTALRFYGNTGSYAVPTYTAMGGETGVTLNLNESTTDVTDKDSAGWKETLAGVKDWNAACTCHYEAGDAAGDQIEDDMIASTLAKCQIKTINSKVYSGDCRYTSMTWGANHDGAVSFGFTAEGTGALGKA